MLPVTLVSRSQSWLNPHAWGVGKRERSQPTATILLISPGTADETMGCPARCKHAHGGVDSPTLISLCACQSVNTPVEACSLVGEWGISLREFKVI